MRAIKDRINVSNYEFTLKNEIKEMRDKIKNELKTMHSVDLTNKKLQKQMKSFSVTGEELEKRAMKNMVADI